MTSRKLHATGLLAALFLAGFGAGPSGAAEPRPALYVYVHTDTKSVTLEKTLQERMPLVTVTVFGRFRDFEEAMTSRRPDAVVALQPLLASQSIAVTLQGFRGDHDWEPYVLLAPAAGLEGPLDSKVIGVVDLLGREGTQQFLTKLLKTPNLKLKRVTKLEDLLPLLQFSAADAVLVPSAAVKGITERSRLTLGVRELPEARVGLPAVGVLNIKVRDLVMKQIQTLDGETNRVLGIERWRGR
jgi:hypothetical protein